MQAKMGEKGRRCIPFGRIVDSVPGGVPVEQSVAARDGNAGSREDEAGEFRLDT